MNSTSDGLWIFDASGTTLFANQALADILGRRLDEMPGLKVSETLDEVGQRQFEAHMAELHDAETGQENLECSLVRPDGRRIWALVSHCPLRDDEGQQRGWLHRITQLPEREELLDQVRASEQQLAEAQSIARVGSWEWDVFNDRVAWSAELFRIFGLSPASFEATYEGFLAHLHPEDRPLAEQAIRTAFTGADHFEFDARVIRQDGSQAWIRSRGRVTRDDAGNPLRMAGTAQEITESVRAAQELAAARDAAEAASKSKSEFLATMSHEIRTPLSGVIGLTELLRSTQLQPQQARLADGIAQAGHTLLALINDILDLSKIEAGKLAMEHVDFDLRDVVDQVLALLSPAAQLNDVALSVTWHAGTPRELRGDPLRFGQVLTNLLSNAVKFSPGGEVHVLISSTPTVESHHRLRVEVKDTGIGISAEAQDDLFESFIQAEPSTTRQFGGSGLGLAISRKLVEALQGEIGVTSSIGVGSTFWFTSTFAEALAKPKTEVASPARTRSERTPLDNLAAGPRGRVLVAEDNAVNRLVAAGMLEASGFTAEVACTGAEAVEAVTSQPDRYQAVLMDCQMPIQDGYAATRAIRRTHGGSRIPIIAMTASARAGDRERCLEAGMNDFLVKPVDPTLLIKTLEHWIYTEHADAPPQEQPGPEQLDDETEDAWSPVLDMDRIGMLQNLRPGDDSFFTKFRTSFYVHSPELVGRLRDAARRDDHAAVAQAAHELRGSAQNLGAVRVGEVCHELESAGLRGDLSGVEPLVRQLGYAVTEAVDALQTLTPDHVASTARDT